VNGLGEIAFRKDVDHRLRILSEKRVKAVGGKRSDIDQFSEMATEVRVESITKGIMAEDQGVHQRLDGSGIKTEAGFIFFLQRILKAQHLCQVAPGG